MRLVGDIGGTHARLRLLSPTGKVVRQEVYDSHAYASLEGALKVFLEGAGGARGHAHPARVTAAAFGIAGPVVNGRCAATNLPWVVDSRVVSRKLGIRKVTLLNDLVALALGAIVARPSHRKLLGAAGAPRRSGANVAVIAAGTGLGEAILVWDGTRLVPTATEGGHTEFGPRDEVEDALLRFLRTRYAGGHVSYERVVSGMGLGNLYDFFRDAQGLGETPGNTERLASASDRNAAIGQLGVEGKSRAATAAVERLVAIYGAEAGNLALKSMSLGGVLVCGNIAGKLLPVFEKGGFMEAFLAKGRFAGVLAKVPVAVVLDGDVGLTGSTRVVMGDV